MIKGGLVSISFRSLSVDDIVKMCEKAQVDCIEWGGDKHVLHGDIALAQKVAKMSSDAGIEVASYGSYYQAGVSEKAEAPLSFGAVLDSAQALGTKTIRVWAGSGLKSAETGDDRRKEIVEDLLRIGDMAAKENIAVGMEFHGGTLTDCNESAIKLKGELGSDCNVNFYWQPSLGYNDRQCMSGIKGLAPRISNVHTFEWSVKEEGGYIRHPLADGAERWVSFLREIAKDGKDHAAMLEFIKDDSIENFYRDAAALKEIIKAV